MNSDKNMTKAELKKKGLLKKTGLNKALSSKVEEFKNNPEKSLIKLSLPVMAGMLVQIVYNITDTAFVGRIGVDALAAVTFSFPLLFIVVALSNMVAMGTTSLVSKAIGSKNQKKAEIISGESLTMSIFLSLILTIIGLYFLRDIFELMGASQSVVELGVIYMRPIMAALFFTVVSGILSAILTAEGNTKIPSMIRIASVLLNLTLDAVFVFVFHLGVLGVSLATMFSFIFGALLFSYYVFIKNDNHLRFGFRKPTKNSLKVLKIGLPMSISQLIMASSILSFNKLFSLFGTSVVAAYGLVGKLDSMMFMPLMGLSIGLVTLIGIFFGAKEFLLIKRVTKASLKYGFYYALPLMVLFFSFPKLFLGIMTSDAGVIAIAVSLLRIDIFGYPFMVLGFILGRAMLGLGDGVPGLVITSVRLIILAVPLALLLTMVIGYSYKSIIVASIISSLFSSFMAVVWFRNKLNKLNVSKNEL